MSEAAMTPPDIPTPETDAAVYLAVAFPTHTKRADANNQNEVVLADFARDLERRLAAATARAEEAETRLFDQVEALRSMTGATETETPMFKARALLSELDRLRKDVERLRECEVDTKRLDWLEGNGHSLIAYETHWYMKFVGFSHLTAKTVRAAIDTAMSNPEKQ